MNVRSSGSGIVLIFLSTTADKILQGKPRQRLIDGRVGREFAIIEGKRRLSITWILRTLTGSCGSPIGSHR